MMRRTLVLTSLVLALASTGCTIERANGAEPQKVMAPLVGGEKHEKVEGCGEETKQIANPGEQKVARADGKAAIHVGAPFTGATSAKVSEVLANPDRFAGQTVTLEGDVSAMCTHERAWFTVVAEDKSGGFVRVLTAPQFLVPAGSVGKSARLEGKIEVVVVPAERARHFAQEHQLGDPQAINGDIRQVAVRATAAEFY